MGKGYQVTAEIIFYPSLSPQTVRRPFSDAGGKKNGTRDSGGM